MCKKRKYTQKYVRAWEFEPSFKPWLCERPENSAYCKFCCSHVAISSGGKADLRSHALTKKHVLNSKSLTLQPSVSEALSKSSPLDRQVMRAEIQMAAFIAEHNISFLTSDHMVPLSKSMFADSEIAKSMKCSRTKVTAIITNVIGAQQKDNVASLLNKHPFALCLDESTDVSAEKSLSVLVRVCYNNNVRVCFFDLVRVRNADAQGIYDSVVKIFQNKNIDYKTNLISFAADGANVMTGSRHSVATMLKKDCPNLIVLKCICHSFTVCVIL